MSQTNGNSNSSPAARLSQTMDRLTEIRAPTAGHAAHLLDVALANRAQNVAISHTLFTLHVYQYKVEKNGSETEGQQFMWLPLFYSLLNGCLSKHFFILQFLAVEVVCSYFTWAVVATARRKLDKVKTKIRP